MIIHVQLIFSNSSVLTLSNNLILYKMRMSDEDETQPPSDYEEDSNDDEEESQHAGNQKQGMRKRRANIPTWAVKGPRPMQFNELGQPVGTYAAKLSRFIGHVARDHALLPLDVHNWGDMEATRLLIAWNRIKEKKSGKKIDRVTKLEICYTRRDGTFISGQTKKVAEDIADVLSTLPLDIQSTTEGRNGAFQHVLGDKDGHGRVFLYGGGVRSIDVSPKRKKGKLANRDIEVIKRGLHEEFEKEYKDMQLKAEAEMEERLKKMVEEQVSKKLEEEQLKRNAQVREHMMQYSPEPSWVTKLLDT